jgi:dTDP-4-amino-4,6-dideoxygalactose transaminase
MAQNSYIPFHVPSVGDEEVEAVEGVLRSGWLTTGPVALAFETEFARYVGCKHALAVNSGTAALQLALDAIGLREGDEVLIPTYTFTATGEVITYFGAKPVLCDSVSGGFNLDSEAAEGLITERTRAIIPVHVGGETCNMTAVRNLARRYNLRVIEDAAHALPASWEGQRVGTISELTAFSFYATKTITTGEGGMLTTDDDSYAERAATMRLHGIGKDAWKRYTRAGSWDYRVLHAGYKLNLPDVLAAIGRAQLAKCDRFWQERNAIAQFYLEHLSQIEELELPPTPRNVTQHSWHLFILRIRPELLQIGRDEFIEQLKELGIGTSVHFIPLHRHPLYRERFAYSEEGFPNAETSFQRALSLPIYPGLQPDMQHRVVQAVTQIVHKNRKRNVVAV